MKVVREISARLIFLTSHLLRLIMQRRGHLSPSRPPPFLPVSPRLSQPEGGGAGLAVSPAAGHAASQASVLAKRPRDSGRGGKSTEQRALSL